jgi:GGDEF domain-containing protein
MAMMAAESLDLCGLAVECYRAAVRNVAFYAIELDKEVTAVYRQALSRLEQRAGNVDSEALPDVMRDYHGRAVAYKDRLNREVEEIAGNLRRILDSLAEGDGDYEGRMRGALVRLRLLARSPDTAGVRDTLLAAVAAVQDGLDEIRRAQESVVAHLLEEIRTLHKGIDSLESAASLDILAALLTREEMEKRMHAGAGRRLLLVEAAGLCVAETNFDSQVATQLAAAFLKRLTLALPPESDVARWSEDRFMVLLAEGREPEADLGKAIETKLSGSYACTQEGKSVRPSLQVRARLLQAGQAAEEA